MHVKESAFVRMMENVPIKMGGAHVNLALEDNTVIKVSILNY